MALQYNNFSCCDLSPHLKFCDILQVSWNWATQFRNEVSREVSVLPKKLESGLTMLTVSFLSLSHVALCHSYRDQISLISTMLLCASSISSWRERAKRCYEVHSICLQAVWEASNKPFREVAKPKLLKEPRESPEKVLTAQKCVI